MRSSLLAGAVAAVLSAAATPASAQNHSPAAPVITEPAVARIVNPADAHMETGPFSDPDAGYTLCDIDAGEELTCNYGEFDPGFEILPGRRFVETV